MYYNYFRDYDPSTGRYLQSDPIGLQGGLNTYAYADNNPLRFVDKLGLATSASMSAAQGAVTRANYENGVDLGQMLRDLIYGFPLAEECADWFCRAKKGGFTSDQEILRWCASNAEGTEMLDCNRHCRRILHLEEFRRKCRENRACMTSTRRG